MKAAEVKKLEYENYLKTAELAAYRTASAREKEQQLYEMRAQNARNADQAALKTFLNNMYK